MPGTIVWYETDLRIADNPALTHAAERNVPVIPTFIWSPEENQPWTYGCSKRWWLTKSLQALSDDLEAKDSRLILREGPFLEQLRALIDETGADVVVWNTRYESARSKRDEEIRRSLEKDGIRTVQFAGQLLHDPEAIRTSHGTPYQVFTPFWERVCETLEISDPLGVPNLDMHSHPASWPESIPLKDLGLSPSGCDGDEWLQTMDATWRPGEKGAHLRLKEFLDDTLIGYQEKQDRPDLDSTSHLSPHISLGEISPRHIWCRVNSWVNNAPMRGAADTFLSKIGAREFAYHVLIHHPETAQEPLNAKFGSFGWKKNKSRFAAWKKGETGYPIVDAGMRQLQAMGWIHSHIRRIVASFLVKDLLIPWQEGAAWFREMLIDADLATGSLGWQWAAGCGADAQPFFQIFNPVNQGEQLDPSGDYVRRWLPELRNLPDEFIHQPWEADKETLDDANVSLGKSYSKPIVDHAKARKKALAAYEKVK